MSSDWKKNVKHIESNRITFDIDNHIKVRQKQTFIDNSTMSLDTLQISANDKHIVNATLDLHHYSINDAYHQLIDFITKNYQTCNKCLLIVTGHGSTTNEIETIKSSLHIWLNNPNIQHMILSCRQAAKKHGGKGAFYILLKRNKNPKTKW